MNYSERYIAIVANLDPQRGGSPHDVAEAIRKNGLIADSLLPFTETVDSVEKYYSPDPMEEQYLSIGKDFLHQYDFKHEWVATDKHDPKETAERMKKALRTSPLGVSVQAWTERNGIYVKEQGTPDNHWVVCVGYDDDYPLIFDSYPPYFKKLMPFYDFGFAKRYLIQKVADQSIKPLTPWRTIQVKLLQLLSPRSCSSRF